MNYLAHIYLARHSPEAMVGALLGDFHKGGPDPRHPEAMARELRLHRLVDTFTDDHPVNRAARTRFPQGRRRFAGVLLDVFHDHFLARTWETRCDEPLEAFLDRFHAALADHAELLPPRLRDAVPWLVRERWLLGYRDLEGIRLTLARMSRRVSRHGEALREGIADLEAGYGAFAADFEAFFPDLERYASEARPFA